MARAKPEAPQHTLVVKIGKEDLSSLAWRTLSSIVEDELNLPDPEPGALKEAEFCLGLKTALAKKCTHILIEIEP